MRQITVPVQVKPVRYDIFLGYGLFDEIAKFSSTMRKGGKIVIVTDDTVSKLHAGNLLSALFDRGLDVFTVEFKAGEKSKTRETKQWIEDQLLDRKLGRDSLLIALGGGVVGDMAGFAAATYMRGIPFIQVPTTVMAQADSSIGGKTAVDVPQGKNLIGAFHQPVAVFIDVKTLLTLDERNYKSGFAEIIKHGIIRDKGLFDLLQADLPVILGRNDLDSGNPAFGSVMSSLMERNCAVKNEIVALDPEEHNLRKILNYGHTIGHAVELLSGYSLLHGEAVAAGMAAEAYMSEKLGFCRHDDFVSQVELIRRFGLPSRIPAGIKTDDILDLLCMDKKARDGKPEMVFIETIGKVKMFGGDRAAMKIELNEVRRILTDFNRLG